MGISIKVETLLRIYAWRTATTIHDACLHFILQFGPVFMKSLHSKNCKINF